MRREPRLALIAIIPSTVHRFSCDVSLAEIPSDESLALLQASCTVRSGCRRHAQSSRRARCSTGIVDGAIEVLLVHPAGNYNRRAPWGIPKGAPDPDEELEATARRETLEETGLEIDGTARRSRSRRLHAIEKARARVTPRPAPDGAAPRCASWEVDKAEFIEITRARRIIHPDQAALLDRLQRHSAPISRRSQVPRRHLGLSAILASRMSSERADSVSLSRKLTRRSFRLDKNAPCGNTVLPSLCLSAAGSGRANQLKCCAATRT